MTTPSDETFAGGREGWTRGAGREGDDETRGAHRSGGGRHLARPERRARATAHRRARAGGVERGERGARTGAHRREISRVVAYCVLIPSELNNRRTCETSKRTDRRANVDYA